MDSQKLNYKMRYPENVKNRAPQINLPFHKTDDSIFKFYIIEDVQGGPRKLAHCKNCKERIEFVSGSCVFSSHIFSLKFHLKKHHQQWEEYIALVALNTKPDNSTKFEHFQRMEYPQVRSEVERDRRWEESKRNRSLTKKNLIGREYVENDYFYLKNSNSIDTDNLDAENANYLEYIHRFTNQNVPVRELIGTHDVNASFGRYKRYKCLIRNIGNMTLDLERLFCENTCFLDPENYESCPNIHTGDIAIFGNKNFQKKIPKLYEELEKYPEFMDEKSFDDILLKDVRSVQKNASALQEMNRLLKIIFSMITVKKDSLNDIMLEIIRKDTDENKLVKPHFAIQLWGPKFSAFDDRDTTRTCNFPESMFYTYQHVNDEDCPGYTDRTKRVHTEPWTGENGQVFYPCNVGGCGKPCDCQSCNFWDGTEIVDCPKHHPDHPEMFNPEEDISISRRVFFEENHLPKYERRSERTWWRPADLKLAGMKKKCSTCLLFIRDHLKNHHSYQLHAECCEVCEHIKLIVENSLALICYICMKKFQSKYRLADHMNIHDPKMKFTCDTCNTNFTTALTLKRHHEEIHGEENKQLSCDECQAEFSSERNLERHKGNFHNQQKRDQEFNCDICSETFTRIDNVDRHKRDTHGIDDRKVILKGINDEEDSYRCGFCENVFKRKSNMQRHEMTLHSAEHGITLNSNTDFIIACKMCEKTFNRKDNLQKHVRNQH